MSAADGTVVRGTREAVSGLQEMVLRKGNYTMPDVQMANLGRKVRCWLFIWMWIRPVRYEQKTRWHCIIPFTKMKPGVSRNCWKMPVCWMILR